MLIPRLPLQIFEREVNYNVRSSFGNIKIIYFLNPISSLAIILKEKSLFFEIYVLFNDLDHVSQSTVKELNKKNLKETKKIKIKIKIKTLTNTQKKKKTNKLKKKHASH